MGLAERVLPSVGPEKEAAVAAEPQHTVLADCLNPAEGRGTWRVFRGAGPGRFRFEL